VAIIFAQAPRRELGGVRDAHRGHSAFQWASAAFRAAGELARALILATFTVQMTLMYFGWRAGAWNLIGVVAGYLAIMLVASNVDPAMHFVEGYGRSACLRWA